MLTTATADPPPTFTVVPLTPGGYLRLRRENAGVKVEWLAYSLGIDPAQIEALEDDAVSPIDFDQVIDLEDHFDFDPLVFVQLVAVRTGGLAAAPDICRSCGCSWNDPCSPPCAWATDTNDLCTGCAPAGELS